MLTWQPTPDGGCLPANSDGSGVKSKRKSVLLTEEQAKARWCPFGIQPIAGFAGGIAHTVGANRAVNGDVPACLASVCMAWRFATPKQLREIDLVTSDVEDENPRLGYCGAFGKPEHE